MHELLKGKRVHRVGEEVEWHKKGWRQGRSTKTKCVGEYCNTPATPHAN